MKEPRSSGEIFATTRWTVVLEAGGGVRSARALEELCGAYWYPLYAYVRRRGHSREDAEDLTQAFFAGFLKSDSLSRVEAGRGRFRAFLLASLKHFLANDWDKSQRQKRGGQAAHLSLDWETADTKFQLADAATESPDRAFDREWAVTLLAAVIENLRAEYFTAGRGEHFDALKFCLAGGADPEAHAAAAVTLGMNAGAVRVAAHRLRRRYRQSLRDEIAQTLVDPAQGVEEEMRTLFGAFSST